MNIIETKTLSPTQKGFLFNLWNAEYPAKITFSQLPQFEVYLEVLEAKNHFLLYNSQETIQGWALTFTREKERWFVVIVAGELHKQGFGTMLLNKLKASEPVLNGWVIDHEDDFKRDGKPYLSPLKFYTKNGFKVLTDTRLELREISAVKICWKR